MDFISCFFFGFVVGVVFDLFFFKRILKCCIKEFLFFVFLILFIVILIVGFMFINFYIFKWYIFLVIVCGIYVYKNIILLFYKGFLKKVNKVLFFNKR